MSSIPKKSWFVYVLLCKDNSFYTGITQDLQKRFEQHQSGKGAKYTRSRGAKKILYFKKCKNHRAAAVRESKIKALTRKEKAQLFA